MTLSWEPDGLTGQAWRGIDEQGRYVAQVVRYDKPRGWIAYVRQQKGRLRYVTAEEAMAAAEGVLG